MLAKTIQLRDYQTRAIEELRHAVVEGKRPVLSLATGAGKTAIAGEIFSLARSRGRKVAFVVPLISIINQTWKAFAAIGLENELSIQQGAAKFDEWGDCLSDTSKPIQICSIQTIAKRGFPNVDIVIFDEIHNFHQAHKDWMRQAPAKTVFIGLSASPWRKGLKDYFNHMIVGATVRELIEQGYLSPYRMFAPAHPDLSGVKTTGDDYNAKQLGEVMNKAPLVADVVETWIKRGEGRPTFVFCVDCSHAQAVAKQFNDAGIAAGYIDARTPIEDREFMLAQLRSHDLQVICNIGTLTAGVDAPFVSCIVLARPTQSEMLYIQIIGRGIRKCEGKDDLIILDHSDTAMRLGMPDSIVYDDFIDGKDGAASDRKNKEPLPKPCSACTYLKPPRTLKCPSCGFEPERKSGIFCEEGELIEVGKTDRVTATHVMLQGQKFTRSHFYQQLKSYQMRKGYAEGWIARKYKDMVGNWPANHFPSLPPIVCSSYVDSWITSRNIAFAKAKQRDEQRRMKPQEIDQFARETI